MISSDVRDIVSSLQRIARALEGINAGLRGMRISNSQEDENRDDEYFNVTDDDPALLRLIAGLSKK